MKYAVEVGSGAIIYIPSLVKIGSAIYKLRGKGGGIHRRTDTQAPWRLHKPTF
jgi:hypothetical protein